jgi:hypothetical protein
LVLRSRPYPQNADAQHAMNNAKASSFALGGTEDMYCDLLKCMLGPSVLLKPEAQHQQHATVGTPISLALLRACASAPLKELLSKAEAGVNDKAEEASCPGESAPAATAATDDSESDISSDEYDEDAEPKALEILLPGTSRAIRLLVQTLCGARPQLNRCRPICRMASNIVRSPPVHQSPTMTPRSISSIRSDAERASRRCLPTCLAGRSQSTWS